ncbi:MAG: tRNA pseudouridine(38-40) synthase TruA [Clostridia bacterium]|nr:tRNA pseudouridine(38-40) synthase TruA [Clostridia bacterium]
MKILIKVKYDGSSLNGSQVQPGLPTVQGELTAAAREVFGFDCDVTGCSRTDSGVHALSYCASISPREDSGRGNWCSVPVGKVPRALNSKLPSSISVCGACSVENSFHPRYDVVSKEYVYLISDSAVRDPFLVCRAWQIGRPLSEDGIVAMSRAGAHFVGRHDFSAFMASGSDVAVTEREITLLSVKRRGDGIIEITVAADGFLYNMVRIIAGTLVAVGRGVISEDEIPSIINSRDRSRAGQTAPPDGLYLSEVKYKEPINWLYE